MFGSIGIFKVVHFDGFARFGRVHQFDEIVVPSTTLLYPAHKYNKLNARWLRSGLCNGNVPLITKIAILIFNEEANFID